MSTGRSERADRGEGAMHAPRPALATPVRAAGPNGATSESDPSGTGEAQAAPADAIPRFLGVLDELAETRIAYCQWKSNLRLPKALSGLTDLDLLIAPQQAPAFREIAGRHRLKALAPPPDAAYPGIEHYLGMDEGSGRLFHLHVHYKLVLGEQYVKNYRLPIERHFLGSTRSMHGVPIPEARLELLVLAARALLKYRARDGLKDILGIRTPGVRAEIRTEIEWLLGQTSINEVQEAARALGEVVPAGPICAFLDIVDRAPRSGYRLLRLKRELRRSMRGFQRQSRVLAGVEYFHTAWKRRTLRELRMTLAQGGAMVALVGADGSGKSTLARALARWLRWKLDVRIYYMGSKAPSLRSRGLYLAFRALRRGHRSLSRKLGSGWSITRATAAARDTVLALHHLSIGWDRARRYREAQRDAQAGRVIIFDRFPVEALATGREYRMLDGPQISETLGDSAGPLARRLARAEERMYKRFRMPDHVVVLDVDSVVSSRRKPDHDSQVLVLKSRAVLELAALGRSNGVSVIEIDATRPLDSVLLDVKKRLWDVL